MIRSFVLLIVIALMMATSTMAQSKSIVQLAIETPNLSTLVTAVTTANLASTLFGGEFTVFAPTNNAFNQLDPALLTSLLEVGNRQLLTDILLYHVVPGSKSFGPVEEPVTTVQGGNLGVVVTNGSLVVQGTKVLASLVASNGIVHVIDRVLLLPSNIPDTATALGATTLLSAVVAAGLDATLASPGPFTVFAPTNAAFDAVPNLNDILNDVPLLTSILQYHVVGSRVNLGKEVQSFTTLQGANVVSVENLNNYRVNEANVLGVVECTNGRIVIIDSVLSLPDTLAATITAKFPTLLAALVATGLETVTDVTVFAPNEDAFGAVDVPALLADLPLLTQILQYHVLSPLTRIDSTKTASIYDTVETSKLVVKPAESVLVNNKGSSILSAKPCTNGLLYEVNKVLAVPQLIPAELTATAIHTTLLAAVGVANLGTTLSGAGPFTVFAPTDTAFSQIDPTTLNGLLANVPLLTSILTYHVIGSFNDFWTAPGTVATVESQTVTVAAVGDGLVVNGESNVIDTIVAGNGIIYVVDKVFTYPPTGATTTSVPLVPIPDLLTAAGDFGTLLAAVTAADLASTLSGPGPFTVFAPTDEAFGKLPAGTVNTLLQDPSGALTDVLLLHVVGSVITEPASGDIALLDTLKTGDQVGFAVVDAAKSVENAVITATTTASNGVVYTVDTVLSKTDLITWLTEQGTYTTLLAALAAANLTSTIATTGDLALWAPADAAFDALPAGTVESLLGDVPALAELLKYHVVAEKLDSLNGVTQLVTLQGEPISVNRATTWKVNGDTDITGARALANGQRVFQVSKVLQIGGGVEANATQSTRGANALNDEPDNTSAYIYAGIAVGGAIFIIVIAILLMKIATFLLQTLNYNVSCRTRRGSQRMSRNSYHSEKRDSKNYNYVGQDRGQMAARMRTSSRSKLRSSNAGAMRSSRPKKAVQQAYNPLQSQSTYNDQYSFYASQYAGGNASVYQRR